MTLLNADGREWGNVMGWGELPEEPLGPLHDLMDLLDEGDDDAWQERALCAQTDPEAFFPEKGGSTRDAKRICMGCEVRDQCLEYALTHSERHGIWGGLSERERRKLEQRRTEFKAADKRLVDAKRDARIVRLRASGQPTTELASRLHCSKRTIERAVARSKEKEAA